MGFERQTIADHANNLAKNVQGNLKRSLEAIGVVRSQLTLRWLQSFYVCCGGMSQAAGYLTG